MSLTVHVAAPQGRLAAPRALVVRAAQTVLRAEGIRSAELSVTFLGDRAIAAMNRRHLGHRGATDVISFGLSRPTPDAPVMGDVYVGVDVARRAARERRITLREELVRLVVHGTLHVLGYDHPEGESRLESEMWARQERLVARVLRSARS
ncbi:MAG TPA: rRNA maturation RNase YbeY [Gemmatimonadaceae bacterium]|nr:rRNA maturation RNase YbeY [Gemmatimonadaceae bacterium]